jgi:hypothetical protein
MAVDVPGQNRPERREEQAGVGNVSELVALRIVVVRDGIETEVSPATLGELGQRATIRGAVERATVALIPLTRSAALRAKSSSSP